MLAVACTKAQAPPVAPAAPPVGAPGTTWPEYELPVAGLRAAFPAPPLELAGDTQQKDIPIRYDGFSLEQDGVEYTCLTSRVPNRDRARDPEALKAVISKLKMKVDRQRAISKDGFRGVEIDALDPKGRVILARYMMVGDGVFIAGTAAQSGKLALEQRRRFLDGCRYEPPWRVFPSVEGGFTISVPANAIEVEPQDIKSIEGAHGRAFVVGGINEITYIVAAVPLDPSVASVADRDALLDEMVETMSKGASAVVWSSAIEVDGARGRDLVFVKDGLYFGWRMLITRINLYQVGMTSLSADVVRGNDARRFRESLRWGPDG